MLNRRQIMASVPGAVAGATVAATTPAQAQAARGASGNRKPVLMKAGANVSVVDDKTMKAVARWGIKNCYAFAAISDPNSLYPSVDDLKKMQDIAHRNGVNVDILRPLNLTMSNIDDEKYPAIMLGQSPQRDRDIEGFQNTIRNCAAAGISGMRYTLSIVGNTRSRTVPGRGDATYVGSRMTDYSGPPRPANRTVPDAAGQPAADAGRARRNNAGGPNSGLINKPITKAGRITADMYWERISYFLDRVVPVANQYKINLASHMEDAMVPLGYEGVDLVTNTVEGAKKFVSIQNSPYHGVLFCIGTFAEMRSPAEVYDAVQWFGANKKIHLVDFRNIRGNREDFVETFPDEGDIDMLRVMQILRDTGYDGMVAPDHTPQTPGGPEQVDAFQYGYIRGLLQAVERLA
jgi:mannonate dehydratase